MTPSEILLAIKADLESWQPPTKFVISIAAEPFHVMELLAETGAQIRVILLWVGDDGVFDGPQELGIALNRYEVTISHAAGLAVMSGEHLHRQSPLPNARPPLVELLRLLRSRIRSLCFPDDETTSRRLEYKGCDPVVTPQGLRLAAYTLRYEIHTALDEEPLREALY